MDRKNEPVVSVRVRAELLTEAKVAAAREHMSLTDFISEAVRVRLANLADWGGAPSLR